MARNMASRPEGNAFTHFFDRIERALMPAFGPAPVAEQEESERAPVDELCPICGHPMFEHVIDRTTSNTVLICPTDERLPEREVTGPYNELGMPANGRRLEKYAERNEGR